MDYRNPGGICCQYVAVCGSGQTGGREGFTNALPPGKAYHWIHTEKDTGNTRGTSHKTTRDQTAEI